MMHRTVIQVIRRLKQEDQGFKASLVRKEVGREGERREGEREKGGKAKHSSAHL